jgi:hypothetical protein
MMCNKIATTSRRQATSPGIGRCVLLGGREGGGTEVGNEDDCASQVRGDGQVERRRNSWR